MDYFEQLHHEILLHILHLVSVDIHALFRLRTLSHRFNSLVILKTNHLLLQVDKFDKIFGTDLGSYRPCFSLKPTTNFQKRNVFMRCFNHVTKLVIELPADYADCLKPWLVHAGVKCMYKAIFGKHLKSCVILYYSTTGCDFKLIMDDKVCGMYDLIEKCAYMAASNVLPNLENLDSLVMKDREGNLELVMDGEGIRECREFRNGARKVLVATLLKYRMRMNQDRCIDIGEGLGQGAAVLGVIAAPLNEHLNDVKEADLVRRAFGSGVHGLAVENLLQNSPYIEKALIITKYIGIESHP